MADPGKVKEVKAVSAYLLLQQPEAQLIVTSRAGRDNPGDGQGAHWALCGGADPRGAGRGLYRRVGGPFACRWSAEISYLAPDSDLSFLFQTSSTLTSMGSRFRLSAVPAT